MRRKATVNTMWGDKNRASKSSKKAERNWTNECYSIFSACSVWQSNDFNFEASLPPCVHTMTVRQHYPWLPITVTLPSVKQLRCFKPSRLTSRLDGADGILDKTQTHIVQLSINCRSKNKTRWRMWWSTHDNQMTFTGTDPRRSTLTSSFFRISPPKVVSNLFQSTKCLWVAWCIWAGFSVIV